MSSANEGSLNVKKEVIVSAAAKDVWSLLGDFNSLEIWHPAVVKSSLAGDGKTPGSQRTLSLPGDATILEDLISHSDDEMNYSYRIVESPLPLADYVSTLQVEAVEDDSTRVVWSSAFNADGVSDEEAIDVVSGIYNAGLESIRKNFE